MTMPTAEQVVAAIFASCNETGDKPIDLINGVMTGGPGRPSIRARHYAMHAILRVFPDLEPAKAAQFVGAPGKPMAFYHNSCNSVARVVSPSGRRFVNWWDETAFERVIAATRDAAPAVELVEPEPIAPAPMPSSPVKLSAIVGSIVEPTRPAAMPGKRRLEDILREAVSNTQRMTPPPEKQP